MNTVLYLGTQEDCISFSDEIKDDLSTFQIFEILNCVYFDKCAQYILK